MWIFAGNKQELAFHAREESRSKSNASNLSCYSTTSEVNVDEMRVESEPSGKQPSC